MTARPHDVVVVGAGIVGLAVATGGSFLDDFWFVRASRVRSVRNAPLPAAASSLAIARHLVDEIRVGLP